MTDLELQLALAKMLPEKLDYIHNFAQKGTEIYWLDTLQKVKDTEWLHVCWLVEKTLTYTDRACFVTKFKVQSALDSMLNLQEASWQQRAKALIAVKGEK